jgi:hypothetical protein
MSSETGYSRERYPYGYGTNDFDATAEHVANVSTSTGGATRKRHGGTHGVTQNYRCFEQGDGITRSYDGAKK